MSASIFEKNFELVDRVRPDVALRLAEWEPQEPHIPYDSPEAIKQLAQRLMNNSWTRILVIYGIGNGQIFEELKPWLERNPANKLFILEDDFAAFRNLLDTELGTELLTHPQTVFEYLRHPSDAIILQVLIGFVDFIVGSFNVYYAALPAYEQRKERHVMIRSQVYYQVNKIEASLEELTLDCEIEANLFSNLYSLVNAKDFKPLMGKFKNVPAIICGGGASLEDYRDQIQELSDRALIFAGGAAINSLSAAHAIPHFCCGVDPTLSHYSRFLLQKVYEVPYLYISRMQRDAVKMMQGIPVALTEGKIHPTHQWFDDELGIDRVDVAGGVSVSTFAIRCAHLLGCNPIILLGIDLGSARKKRYAEGVGDHPVIIELPNSKQPKPIVYPALDVAGNPIESTYQFILESQWISSYATANPDTLFVNSSEHGKQIAGLMNRSFPKVVEGILTESYDLRGRVHAEVTSSNYLVENLEEVTRVLREWKCSLEACIASCEKVIETFEEKEVAGTGWEYLISAIDVASMELSQQVAFVHQLKRMDSVLIHVLSEWERLWPLKNPNGTPEEFEKIRIHHLYHRFLFLRNKAYLLSLTVDKVINDPPAAYTHPISRAAPEDLAVEEQSPDGIREGEVTFSNSAGQRLSQTLFKNSKREGEALRFYESGSLYSQNVYANNQFEGLQTYYYPDSTLRTEMEYKDGILEGKVNFYYPSGKKKREQTFKAGKRHGWDRIWNAQGQLLIEVNYDQDRPLGTARSWHPNGQLQLEIHFDSEHQVLSVRHWNRDGVMIEMRGMEKESAHTIKQVRTMQEGVRRLEAELKQKGDLIKEYAAKEKTFNPKASMEELEKARQSLEKLKKFLESGE